MNSIVKTIAIAALLLTAVPAAANTGDEKAITLSQLPAAARQTIMTHFPGHKVSIAKVESELFSKTYTVIFTNGEKIEFDGKGRFKRQYLVLHDSDNHYIRKADLPFMLRPRLKKYEKLWGTSR